ncbi:MAG: hypothetical protein WCK90_04245 [archaeon]
MNFKPTTWKVALSIIMGLLLGKLTFNLGIFFDTFSYSTAGSTPLYYYIDNLISILVAIIIIYIVWSLIQKERGKTSKGKKEKEIRGWKKWPSWVKSGIIGSVVLDILFLLGVGLALGGNTHGTIYNLFVKALTLITYPISLVVDFLPFINVSFFRSMVLSTMWYFIVGAIIGWIIGKIRSKK